MPALALPKTAAWLAELERCSSMKGAMSRIDPTVLQTAAHQFQPPAAAQALRGGGG